MCEALYICTSVLCYLIIIIIIIIIIINLVGKPWMCEEIRLHVFVVLKTDGCYEVTADCVPGVLPIEQFR